MSVPRTAYTVQLAVVNQLPWKIASFRQLVSTAFQSARTAMMTVLRMITSLNGEFPIHPYMCAWLYFSI